MGLCEKSIPFYFPNETYNLGCIHHFQTHPALTFSSPLITSQPLHLVAEGCLCTILPHERTKISTTSAASAARYSHVSYFCIHRKVETCCYRKDVETFERCESESVLVSTFSVGTVDLLVQNLIQNVSTAQVYLAPLVEGYLDLWRLFSMGIPFGYLT